MFTYEMEPELCLFPSQPFFIWKKFTQHLTPPYAPGELEVYRKALAQCKIGGIILGVYVLALP